MSKREAKKQADTAPNAADPEELRRMLAADPVLAEPPVYRDMTWPGVVSESIGTRPVTWMAGPTDEWHDTYAALAKRAKDMAADRRESAPRRKAARELATLFRRYLAFGTPKEEGGLFALYRYGPAALKHLDEMDRVGRAMQALAVRLGWASGAHPVYVTSTAVRGRVLDDRLARQAGIIKAWAVGRTRQERDAKSGKGGEGGNDKPKVPNGGPLLTTKAVLAVAVLMEHPDWTNKQIAKVVPCHPKSMSRWSKFVGARKWLAEARKDLPAGTNLIGKDDLHDVEAWDGGKAATWGDDPDDDLDDDDQG